jgi:predicted RNA binding protein YcfA (HicA-like mRNA interferase family)
MSRHEKLLEKVMSGSSDAAISFSEMVALLNRLGFIQRRSGGSHVIFQDGPHFVNLQNKGGKVKSYQVRQIREILKQREK